MLLASSHHSSVNSIAAVTRYAGEQPGLSRSLATGSSSQCPDWFKVLPCVSLSQLFAVAFSNYKIQHFLLVLQQSVGTPVPKPSFIGWDGVNKKPFPSPDAPSLSMGFSDSCKGAVNCDKRFGIKTLSQFARYGRILRSTSTTANSHVVRRT